MRERLDGQPRLFGGVNQVGKGALLDKPAVAPRAEMAGVFGTFVHVQMSVMGQ